ncbi:MAG: RluA family pseudouridine synthase [Candidatus Lambdaproteobacteria bacterium]|nr:RluA family pseudouridine synthase [Candidatus Lambdaproteobacteria bacterium]
MRILHLEPGFVVVDKPAGLATVLHPEERERLPRGAWPDTLERLLPPLIARAERQRGAQGRAGVKVQGAVRVRMTPLRVVQRLDIGTSGVLVFARTRSAERALANQFRRHSVQRRYLAVVQGVLRQPRRVESLLVENRGDGLRGSHPSRGRRAVTHVTPQEALGDCTLIGCRLETGRTHQIRIHLAEAGLPLCGETLYNRPRFGEPVADCSGAPRIMLHAGELGFAHPDGGRPLSFNVPAPADFQAFVAGLRRRAAGPQSAPDPSPAQDAEPGAWHRAPRPSGPAPSRDTRRRATKPTRGRKRAK